jgi:hypothetical protein
MNRPDDFRIDLCVKHPSVNPSAISESLSIKPEFAWGVGDLVGSRVRTSTLWHGTLVEGSGATEFERALESVLSVLSDRLGFLNQTMASGGELSLTIRTFAEVQDGKAAEIHLNAPFLEALALRRIDLAFEVWMKAAEVGVSK